ncbi:hypothetical protein DPMN_139033 [Dreissena polymorpha]|uniref:Uncharacterized protein n=1 Tax=Dreissena polymorpha TaxID=45954 RepID=A0A9D4G4Y4_DREPO|nr:hypothetical protein DPMN_139033 [Dreissena polymorpha]
MKRHTLSTSSSEDGTKVSYMFPLSESIVKVVEHTCHGTDTSCSCSSVSGGARCLRPDAFPTY